MTDEELAAVVQAVKTVLTERETPQRTEVELLRQDLAALQAKFQAHREATAESQQRMAKILGDDVGAAVAPRFQQLQQRTAELERRAMQTGAAS